MLLSSGVLLIDALPLATEKQNVDFFTAYYKYCYYTSYKYSSAKQNLIG